MAYDFTTDGSRLLTSQGQPVANFAHSAAALFWAPGEPASPGGLRLTFRHLGRVHTVNLDIQSGSLLQQLCRAVPTCRILLPARREAVENYLLELAAAHPRPPGLYFPRTGLYRLPESGTWVYACGSEVLGLPQGTDFLSAPEIAHLRLATDPALSSNTAARELLRVLEQDPAIYFPLWSFTLLGMLHSALSRLDAATFPVCALTGSPGFGKTTLVRRFVLLFQDTGAPEQTLGELDAMSTQAYLRQSLSAARDRILLLDDMTAAASPSEAAKRRAAVQYAVRFAANGSVRGAMPGGTAAVPQCQAGLLFTGEYALSEPSLVSRLLWIRLDHQMQRGRPEDRVLAATALRHFLLWLLPQLEDALANLQSLLADRNADSNPRQSKGQLLSLWVLDLFLTFCRETGTVTEHYQAEALHYVRETLDAMAARQAQFLARTDCRCPRGNLSWYILNAYRQGRFQTVSSRSRLVGDACLVQDDMLYIRSATLCAVLREWGPTPDLTQAMLGKQLKRLGLISVGKELRTAGKKIHGRRYYQLSFQALRQTARSY